MVRLSCLLILAGCAPASTRTPPAKAVAPTPKPECVVEGNDVDLHFLMMHAELPASATIQHPFAQIQHANHVHVELVDNRARIEIESSMLRLHGMAKADETHLFPASVSMFGEMIVPLATNRLEWRATVRDQVSLVPGREPGTSVTIAPEWRSCSYLKLRPEPKFDLDKQLGLHRTQQLKLERGGYGLFSSADAPASKVSLYLTGNEVFWILEDTGKHWVKVLWQATDTAFLGWLDRSAGPGPSLGHGSGTGSGKPATCTAPQKDCEDDVTLYSKVDGKLTEIGIVKNGAAFTTEGVEDDYAVIHVCDPDVTLIGTIVVRDYQALGCFPLKKPAQID